NGYGELGDGSTTNHATPATVAGLNKVTDIGAGSFHSLAVRKNGSARAWGYNGYGQLGNGTTTDSALPVAVS
ncbi:MAG TPA: hypothetical protein VHT91_04055, partial [Kofleriaceae bacterium]|nr:hypothetical protein [Kofleriaceae bacterium]